MRVLLTTWAWPSQYFPMVPLGWALRAAGHEVRVAAMPALNEVITQSGLPAVAVGHDVDAVKLIRTLIPGRPQANPRAAEREEPRRNGPRIVDVFVRMAEAMADDTVAFARAWAPDFIVHDPTTYAGPLAAAAIGVPAVRHLWGADIMYASGAAQTAPAALAPLSRRFGLEQVETLGTVTLDPCPPSMQVPAAYWRQGIRYTPYNGAGGMPTWLLEPPRRPRVCVTWGTTIARLDERMFLASQVIEAISSLEIEIVAAISTTQRTLLGTVPPEVRVSESVPLHLLLPTCDLVIAQGGAGTIMTSLTCGLPLLLIPQTQDHLLNSKRLAATGAGSLLTRSEASPDQIRAHVRALLQTPSYREAAHHLHQEIRGQPTPAEVVGVLENLVSTGLSVPAGSTT